MTSVSSHPGNASDATLDEQAHFVLELLCALGGRAHWPQLEEKINFKAKRLDKVLYSLNSKGYVRFHILPGLIVRYEVTLLGWSAAELASNVRSWGLDRP